MPAARSCRTRGCSTPTAPCASVSSVGGTASSPSTCSSVGTGAKPPALAPFGHRTCVRSIPMPKSNCLPSRAFPLRVSQGPRGLPAPNRGDARCRRRRAGAHVPALPWRVTIHVRLCGAWRTDVTRHNGMWLFAPVAAGSRSSSHLRVSGAISAISSMNSACMTGVLCLHRTRM